ncbi:MAG: ATP-binding protein [Steroidobacteraceae bacterium]
MRSGTRSLEARLIGVSLLWILLGLGAAALVLSDLYRGHVEREHAERMGAYLDELAAAVEVAPAGGVILQRDLSDPLFRRPYSGLYWEVMVQGSSVLRSRSLWDTSLGATSAAEMSERPAMRAGPEGQRLTSWTRVVHYPDSATPVVMQVAADGAHIGRMTASFTRTLVISLAILALGLAGLVIAQVQFGLAPLRRLARALTQLRDAQVDQIAGDYPSEIRPLVEDLNAVLHENRELLSRARAQAGNLAHALKTPLAVIRNALPRFGTAPEASLLMSEVERMHEAIERHLVRARSGATALPRRQVSILPVLEEIARVIERIHGERVSIELAGGTQAGFRGDAADLQEIVGNLLENAAKWARSRVRVGVTAESGQVRIVLEDDGPGIAPQRRAEAVQRGVRLDTSRPGSGLGLQIVDDLCRIYGGTLELGDSALGGLSATVTLPGHA